LARATHAGSLSNQDSGPIGMLSKMGGRYIHYYSDELTDMLLNDILLETVVELQDIEQKMKKTVVEGESKQLAEDLL
jgi:hypothetical protein